MLVYALISYYFLTFGQFSPPNREVGRNWTTMAAVAPKNMLELAGSAAAATELLLTVRRAEWASDQSETTR